MHFYWTVLSARASTETLLWWITLDFYVFVPMLLTEEAYKGAAYLVERLCTKDPGVSYFQSCALAGRLASLLLGVQFVDLHRFNLLFLSDFLLVSEEETFNEILWRTGFSLKWGRVKQLAKEYAFLMDFACTQLNHDVVSASEVYRPCLSYDDGLKRASGEGCMKSRSFLGQDHSCEQLSKKQKLETHAPLSVEELSSMLGNARWAGIDDDGGELQISTELLRTLKVVRLTDEEFDEKEECLKHIAESCQEVLGWKERVDGFGNLKDLTIRVEWEKTMWTKKYLQERKFLTITEATVVVAKGRIVLLYVPSNTKLCYLDSFGSAIKEQTNKNGKFNRTIRGISLTGRGSSKPSSGLVYMKGCHKSQVKKGISNERRHYSAGSQKDEEFCEIADAFIKNEALVYEQLDIPVVSHWRSLIVSRSDPEGFFTIQLLGINSKVLRTFAVSATVSYVVVPHHDTGGFRGMTESIMISSTDLELPHGHEWNFVAAGMICRLDMHKSCRLYVPLDVWHGTLPTHSSEPSHDHGGVGSAIVVKTDMVMEGLKEQGVHIY